MSQMGITIIFALSYNMLLGQSGMLSFGHAVYSGLGAFFAIHAMRWIGAGTLIWPMSLLPLIGGFAGALFGVIFGYLTTRRAGTPFAMITLGIGEMVFAASLMFPGFFGGEGGVTADRASGSPFLGIPGITFGPQIQVYYLIAAWCFALHDRDVRADANAARPDRQRSARQPRARGIHRLQHAARAVADVDPVELLRRHRGRTVGDQFRDCQRRERQCGPFRRRPARCVHGRRCVFLRPDSWRRGFRFLCGRAVRVHKSLAALPRRVLRAARDVRARWVVQPDPDESARAEVQEVLAAARPICRSAARRAGARVWNGADHRADVSRHAECRPGTRGAVFGFLFDTTRAPGWVFAVSTLAAAAVAFEFYRRRFKQQWDEAQVEIEDWIRENP